MGQRLATRLRVLMLKSLLRQDAAFFDRPENANGTLMAALAGDAASVRGAVGVLCSILSCIVASYAIAFYNRWRWCAGCVCGQCAALCVCVCVCGGFFGRSGQAGAGGELEQQAAWLCRVIPGAR